MSAGNLSFGISGSGISGSSLPRLQSKSQQPARGGSSSRSARAPTKKTTLRSAAASGKPKQKSSRGGNYGQQRRHDPSEPISMERATVWSPEVEEAYRIQGSGWRSIHEYRRANGEPTRWENGMVKMTVHPKTGYFMYWSKDRQCAESYLSKVKIYHYATPDAEEDKTTAQPAQSE